MWGLTKTKATHLIILQLFFINKKVTPGLPDHQRVLSLQQIRHQIKRLHTNELQVLIGQHILHNGERVRHQALDDADAQPHGTLPQKIEDVRGRPVLASAASRRVRVDLGEEDVRQEGVLGLRGVAHLSTKF